MGDEDEQIGARSGYVEADGEKIGESEYVQGKRRG